MGSVRVPYRTQNNRQRRWRSAHLAKNDHGADNGSISSSQKRELSGRLFGPAIDSKHWESDFLTFYGGRAGGHSTMKPQPVRLTKFGRDDEIECLAQGNFFPVA